MKVYLDTSILIAGVSPVHSDHTECASWLKKVVEGDVDAVCDEHVLLEAYLTLTGSPVPLKTSPKNAVGAISYYFEFIKTVKCAMTNLELIQEAELREVIGGTVFDLRHVIVAEQENVEAIITKNTKHFRRLWKGKDGIMIGV